MITRWHYCISVDRAVDNALTVTSFNVIHGSECRNGECFELQRTLDCKKKTSTCPNRREIPLIRRTGWSTTEREERQRDRDRGKRMGGGMLYDKGGYTPDRCRTCLNYRRKVLPPELTNTILNSSLCRFIGMKHISPTCIYIIPIYLKMTAFTKKPPPNVISHIFFCNFLLLWGSTHDSVDCWSAHRSPAARDIFKRVRH